jgi:hypothetical protein
MAINEQVKINSERIDDIPVIVEWLKKMEIGSNSHFEKNRVLTPILEFTI